MTRVYFATGRLRLKVLLAISGSLALFWVAETEGFRRILAIAPEIMGPQRLLTATMMAAVFMVTAGFSWIYLRPVSRLLGLLREGQLPPREVEEPARRAALRFPLLLSTVSLIVTFVVIAAGLLLSARWHGMVPENMVELGLGASCIAMAAIALLYVTVGAIVRPVVAHFRHEEVPAGLRVSAGSKVALTVLTIALAVDVPAAIIVANHLQHRRDQLHLRGGRALAEALAYGATELDGEALRRTAAGVVAATDVKVRFSSTPAPTAAPLPAPFSPSYLTVKSGPAPASSSLPLILLTAALLALGALIGGALGRTLSGEISQITHQVERMADPEQAPAPAEPAGVPALPAFGDLRELWDAVGALLDRFTQIHLTHYLAIEKSLATERMKMQFLANVSHDLRSPLNSIMGFSELLLRDPDHPLEPQTHQFVERVFSNGQRLLRLVDQVLDLARIEAGRVALHPENVLMADVVRRATERLNRDPLPEAIKLRIELQPGLPAMALDGHRLGQAIELLIRLSASFMEEGEIVARVSLTTDREGQRLLQLRVADTSQGLEAEDVGRLQAGFQRRPGVTGLGLELPLARAFVDLHGGTLQVASTPGVGNTFAADIPVRASRGAGRLRPVKI